jgi:ribosomal protein S21
MANVTVKGDDFEKTFKQFKIRCKKEGILREYREKQHYTKPSEKKRKNARKKR